MAKIERLIFRALNLDFKPLPENEFHITDISRVSKVFNKQQIERFNQYCLKQGPFLDVYNEDAESETVEGAKNSLCYLKTAKILAYDEVLEILCNKKLIQQCQSFLGPSAKVTWMWLWYTKPMDSEAPNQKWHRDSSEPFNFVRVFIPLTPVLKDENGPTEVIPSTSRVLEAYIPQRYEDEDLTHLKGRYGIEKMKCDQGDVYFTNTFGLHRGTNIAKGYPTRGMFSLLVSLHPSYRTPGMPRIQFSKLNSANQKMALENKSWLSFCVDFKA